MLQLPTRTGERPRYKTTEVVTRKFTKLIAHMSTFCKWINAEVPEAKSKSHDALAVSNASQLASKLHLLTNTSQGKTTSGFQVNAQVFSCLNQERLLYVCVFTHKSEAFISHRCASVSPTGKHVRQLTWMNSLGLSGTSQSHAGKWTCGHI